MGYNSFFFKSPLENCAWVISLRDIIPNEEIFADYGRWYWIGKTPSKLSTQFLTDMRLQLSLLSSKCVEDSQNII